MSEAVSTQPRPRIRANNLWIRWAGPNGDKIVAQCFEVLMGFVEGLIDPTATFRTRSTGLPGKARETDRVSHRAIADLAEDELITLKDASEIFFGGRVTVATLKAEHAKGHLDISKFGRSYFTTPAKLKAMEAKCHAKPPARSSGSIRSEEPGQSSTVEGVAARDSLLMKLDGLKKPSGNTSRGSTSSRTAQRRSLQTS